MGFLSTIRVDKDFARQAFALLKKGLTPLPKPASIVEIGLDEDDYEQLKAWLAQKHWDSHIENALITGLRSIDPKSGHTDSEIVGLLLHALYAEHSRRAGAEWLYWPVIRKLDWHYSVEHWFSGNNPSLAHKNILAAAAEKFSLRNSFDDGGAEWFMTGKLQFGFTMRGAEEKLQDWLTNPHTRTHAINALLGTDGLGLESQSFKDLFAGLLNYRRNNLSPERTKVLLESSPWVLRKSIDGLMEAAKRSASEAGTDGDYSLQPEFLSPPLLRVAGQEVFFHIEISGLASIGLDDTDHEIVDGEGTCVAHLKYVGENGFQCMPAGISVPWAESHVERTYTLRPAGSPALITTQAVRCWEPADWVQVFSQDGRWLRNERSIPQQVLQSGFDLICPAHCVVQGTFVSRQNIDENWVLYRGVQATGGEDVKVMHDGDVIWDSQSAKSQDGYLQQAKLVAEISPIMGTQGQFNGECTLHISINPFFDIRRAQVGRHKLNPAKCCQPGGESFIVDHDEWCSSLPVVVRAKALNGQSGIIRTRVNLRPPTFIWMKDALPIGKPYKFLLAGSDSVPRLGVGPVRRDDSSFVDGQLFEGNRHRGKCPQGAFTPAGLSGLGESVTVWPGVFNEPHNAWVIANHCIDQGIIKKCVYVVDADGAMEVQVKVSKSSARSEAIGWVACLSGPRTEKLEIKSKEDRDLVLKLPDGATKDNLLAIIAVYEDRRVGSWFNKKDPFSPHLILDVARSDEASVDEAVKYARVIRAGKLPILEDNTAYHLRAWIKRSHIQVLLALLQPVITNLSVGFCEAGESGVMRDWNRAVGLAYESNPNKGCKELTLDEAMEVLKFFNSGQPIGPLLNRNGVLNMVELTRQMAFVSPVLARDVLRQLSTQLGDSLTPATWLAQIKQSLSCSQKDIDDLGKPLRMQIDPTFFATTLSARANAQPIVLRNLTVLLQLPTPNDRSRHAARDQRTAYLLSQ